MRTREREEAVKHYLTSKHSAAKKRSLDYIEKEVTAEEENRHKRVNREVDINKQQREREENIMRMVRDRKAKALAQEIK